MKLAFIECRGNSFSVFEEVSQATEEIANCEVAKHTAPELLAVPVTLKKAFTEGADSAIVFVTAGPGDHDAVTLVHEKMLDVQIEFTRYAFLVVCGSSQKDANAVKDVVDAVSKASESAGIGEITQPPAADGMGMFSAQATEANATPSEDEARELLSDDVHSLF